MTRLNSAVGGGGTSLVELGALTFTTMVTMLLWKTSRGDEETLVFTRIQGNE